MPNAVTSNNRAAVHNVSGKLSTNVLGLSTELSYFHTTAERCTLDCRDKPQSTMKRTSESLLVLTKPLRMRALKMPRADYNSIPDGILLIPGKDVVVGRSSEASHVALRSSKLPAMLSRRHAVLSYSSTDKHWLVEDLKVSVHATQCRGCIPCVYSACGFTHRYKAMSHACAR